MPMGAAYALAVALDPDLSIGGREAECLELGRLLMPQRLPIGGNVSTKKKRPRPPVSTNALNRRGERVAFTVARVESHDRR